MKPLDTGLAFLASTQEADGSFQSFSSPYKLNFSKARPLRTNFIVSQTLLALTDINREDVKNIKTSGTQYLLGQRSAAWSWNYWTRDAPETKSLPYPDDLDDTFCALSAIWQHNPELINGRTLASVTRLLIGNEHEPGGPYRTWLMASSSGSVWQDVDLAVNANIAYFLYLQGVKLPSIDRFLVNAIANDGLYSPYYPSNYPILYFAARWSSGELSVAIRKQLTKTRQRGYWYTPLQTALAVSSLVRLGLKPAKLENALRYLLQTQQADGSWPAEAFCTDPDSDECKHFAGAASLTTAFCMEALWLLQQNQPKELATATHYQQVQERVKQVIMSRPADELRKNNLRLLRVILARDSDQQILTLPLLVAKAFDVQPPRQVLLSLAEASLWGWMAYTVFDDFLDEEGEVSLLPSAIYAARQLNDYLARTMPHNGQFQLEVSNIMRRLDSANAWELEHCRGQVTDGVLSIDKLPHYKNYQQLADRSLGHTISGLGVLYASKATASQLQALRDFFDHYLIARQLNDDAHDWEADLAYGHINAVGVLILKRWQKNHHQTDKLVISLRLAKTDLQQCMWTEVINTICKQIAKHIRLARQALSGEGLSIDVSVLEKLLQPLEVANQEALTKRNLAQEFIKNF